MKCLLLIGLFILAACGTVSQTPTNLPTTAPIAYGTVLGYDEVTTGKHITEMEVFDKPAGAPAPYATVGYIHEGDRVAILEQRSDGTIRIRTPSGAEGWIQIDYLKHVQLVYHPARAALWGWCGDAWNKPNDSWGVQKLR
jgi:hypothetical protein